MPAVVSDSSPFVYLARLQRLDLLRKLYDKIFIPTAVWREVATEGARNPEGVQVKAAATEGWIIVEACPNAPVGPDRELSGLGEGEREAILMALSKKALLIIDELDGRQVAARRGVSCTGSLGVLVEAKLRGLLPELRPELERLKRETNFRFTDELFEIALKQSGER